MCGLERARACGAWCERRHACPGASTGMHGLVRARASTAWCEHGYAWPGVSTGMRHLVRAQACTTQYVCDLLHAPGVCMTWNIRGLVLARACRAWCELGHAQPGACATCCICLVCAWPGVWMAWYMHDLVHEWLGACMTWCKALVLSSLILLPVMFFPPTFDTLLFSQVPHVCKAHTHGVLFSWTN